MKKIYLFYLYGPKDEMTKDNYPAIDGLDCNEGYQTYQFLYAWTTNKNIRKLFKSQRDMSKFHEVVSEMSTEEIDKFSDKYSDTFLEKRGITTKVSDTDVIKTATVTILTTSQELETLASLNYEFTMKQLAKIINGSIHLRESHFNTKYKDILSIFRFDDILSFACPMEEDGIPFNPVTEDILAIYTHMFCNTYRKDI